jgi:HD superfamily phosphohydrolase YqeK
LPPSFLHGPATAGRLEAEGCLDSELLDAIRYHTLGHRSLARLGRALIAADFLEPGRKARARWRAALRARAPAAFDPVVREVLRAKLERGLEGGQPLGIELVELWNVLARHEEAEQGHG